MFLSRIFSSLSPYQGQKLCFLTFLNIKSDFSPPLFYKAWLLPPKPRFLRRFFCSLQRKYRAALCITKCSYPRLLLSWGSYAVKNSALIFLLSYSLVTHLLLIQRFLTYFSTIPYKTVTSALFLFCFLTLRQAEVLTEKILSIFSACRGHFLPSRDFYRTNFQSNSFANGDSYRKKRPLRLSPAA